MANINSNPSRVVDDPKRPWKAIVAAAIAVLIIVVQVVQSQWADGSWTREDTFVTALALLSALGVYLTPNPKVTAAPQNDQLFENLAPGGQVEEAREDPEPPQLHANENVWNGPANQPRRALDADGDGQPDIAP
jgi:hypothetical protein